MVLLPNGISFVVSSFATFTIYSEFFFVLWGSFLLKLQKITTGRTSKDIYTEHILHGYSIH